MEKIEIKGHSKYFFIASFILLIIISLVIIWPFFTTILGSILLAYIFYPFYNKLFLLIKNKNAASFIVSFVILLLLVGPILIATNAIIKESAALFYNIRDINIGIEDLSKNFLSKYFFEGIDIANYLKSSLNKLSIGILQKTDSFILGLPEKIINFFIMFFIIFYLFKDGKNLVDKIKRELPLKEKYKQGLIKKFDDTLYATIYGLLVASFVQGIFAIIGFYIFNIQSPLLLGFLTFIAAILPLVGSALIWLPTAIIKIISGDSFNGIGLLIYSILVISSVDNIIKAKIIEKKSKLHPVLALLGVLGGLQIFGLIGVIIGPLSIAILMVFFEFYIIEKREAQIIFKM